MRSPSPQPSARFVRAAVSERDDLVGHRARLATKRDELLAEIRRLEEGIAELDQRLTILRQLLGSSDSATVADQGEAPSGPEPLAAAARTLRGPAIREVAVEVVVEQPEYIEALHYRQWYELLVAAGYAVAGKDPLAVFLTQITRSPVVRKGTESGVYELDRQAPLRIRQRLERLHSELRELTASPATDADIASVRARRHELDLAISKQERALEEALRVLSRENSEVPQAAAGGG